MNTILSRLNAVFAYSVTVLAVLTALCFLSTAFKDRRADSSIDVSASGIQMLVTDELSRVQYAITSFCRMLTREHNLIEGSNELANLLLNLKASIFHFTLIVSHSVRWWFCMIICCRLCSLTLALRLLTPV